jgi:hypothetical protein
VRLPPDDSSQASVSSSDKSILRADGDTGSLCALGSAGLDVRSSVDFNKGSDHIVGALMGRGGFGSGRFCSDGGGFSSRDGSGSGLVRDFGRGSVGSSVKVAGIGLIQSSSSVVGDSSVDRSGLVTVFVLVLAILVVILVLGILFIVLVLAILLLPLLTVLIVLIERSNDQKMIHKHILA